MPAGKLKPVQQQFGGPLPEGLAVLSAAEAKDLAAALVEAERVQTAELDRAIDHTLRFLPWPLNAVVKKILIG